MYVCAHVRDCVCDTFYKVSLLMLSGGVYIYAFLVGWRVNFDVGVSVMCMYYLISFLKN